MMAESIQGYGIQRTEQGRMTNIGTDGNYISIDAFQNGLRQYPNKDAFHYFLPAWINPEHAAKNPKWITAVQWSLKKMGVALGLTGFVPTILYVYPELMNTMVVKIMNAQSDVRASSVVFRCLMNLLRSFYHLSLVVPGLKAALLQKVGGFVTNEQHRRKKVTANVGLILAMTLILDKAELNWSHFLAAFEEECSLRRVLWWQRGNVAISDYTTFLSSEIGRNNVLFQVMLRSLLHEKPLLERIAELDRLHCNFEGDVEVILRQWKATSGRVEDGRSWLYYYKELQALGYPGPQSADIFAQLNRCISKANSLEGYYHIPSTRSRDADYSGYDNRREEGYGGRGRGSR